MSDAGPVEGEEGAIRTAAAQWTIRRDRGLSAAESIEFELWLAADPRHPAAMSRTANAWSLLDRAPESVAQRELALAAVRRRRRRSLLTFGTLAAAAALVILLATWRGSRANVVSAPPAPTALVATGPREVTLVDGTLVRLNTGGEVREDFDAAERRVHLTRGEAHFTVVPNAARPFVVIAGSLRVRAVGTAFNVNLQSARVEVLVTEGKVSLATEAGPAEVSRAPLVQVGELATFATATARAEAPESPARSSGIQVTRLDPGQIAQTLAWQESLVRLGGATLAELALEFERRFGERILVAEPAIGELRAGGRVRADDAESFARLLATTFDLEVERAADGTRILRKKSSSPR